jgi:hypothetical protein
MLQCELSRGDSLRLLVPVQGLSSTMTSKLSLCWESLRSNIA